MNKLELDDNVLVSIISVIIGIVVIFALFAFTSCVKNVTDPYALKNVIYQCGSISNGNTPEVNSAIDDCRKKVLDKYDFNSDEFKK